MIQHIIPYHHISFLTGIRISFIGETIAAGKQDGNTHCKILPVDNRTGAMVDAKPRMFNYFNPGKVIRKIPALQNTVGFDVIEFASIDSMQTIFIGLLRHCLCVGLKL